MSGLRLTNASGRLLEAMRQQPRGMQSLSNTLSLAAGISPTTFGNAIAPLVAARVVKQEKLRPRLSLWSLSEAGYMAEVDVTPADLSRPRIARKQRSEMAEVPRAVVHGNLRDFMATGDTATCGDPLRGLADAMDAARKVLAAKDKPGARFKGSEVDLLVARELRQIAEAAERAKVNLVQALEVMG